MKVADRCLRFVAGKCAEYDGEAFQRYNKLDPFAQVEAAFILIVLVILLQVLTAWREFWQSVGETIRRYCKEGED